MVVVGTVVVATELVVVGMLVVVEVVGLVLVVVPPETGTVYFTSLEKSLCP